MKLYNRRNGGEYEVSTCEDDAFYIYAYAEDRDNYRNFFRRYDSLEEFNEEWEDV